MVLFINACVRKQSRTRKLAEEVLSKLDGEVLEIRLHEMTFPAVDEAFLQERDRLIDCGEFANPLFDLARQFAWADQIVIAAPYWDLSFPAVLKQYIEQINVIGITFRYTPEGVPQGLCKATKLYYVTTAGGMFVPEEFGFGYVKSLAQNFYGIQDVELIKEVGLDIVAPEEADMNLFEEIRSRRSVRTFDGTPLSQDDERAVIDYAVRQDNPYGIRIEWRLLDARRDGLSSPVIVGTDTYIAGKMKRVPHAEEAFGFEFEKIVLFAQSLGVGTTWIAGTMNRPAFEKAMDLASDEVLPCVSPLGYPAKKMSLRETMMRKGIRADSRFDFSTLFFDCSFDRPLTSDGAGKLSDVLEAVRLAPSAVNKQPWRVVVCPDAVHFYEKHGRGYVSDDGWDIQKIDMGIAVCHFELAAEICGFEVGLEIRDPGLQTDEDLTYIASCTYKEKP